MCRRLLRYSMGVQLLGDREGVNVAIPPLGYKKAAIRLYKAGDPPLIRLLPLPGRCLVIGGSCSRESASREACPSPPPWNSARFPGQCTTRQMQKPCCGRGGFSLKRGRTWATRASRPRTENPPALLLDFGYTPPAPGTLWMCPSNARLREWAPI